MVADTVENMLCWTASYCDALVKIDTPKFIVVTAKLNDGICNWQVMVPGGSVDCK